MRSSARSSDSPRSASRHETVSGLEGAEHFRADPERMYEQAAETEQRTDALVDGLEGKGPRSVTKRATPKARPPR